MSDFHRQLHMLAAWQRRLLPRALPEPPGWQLAALFRPGQRPGGDYHDVVELPDHRLLLLLADASDEGAPALAQAAMVRSILRSCPLSSGTARVPFCPFQEPVLQPPHLILGHLNDILTENFLEEQHLTMFCGVLDPVDGNFHYSNAGHPAPRWWHASGTAIEPIRDCAGLPLGFRPRASYHHKRLLAEPGDVLLLYSGGLTAAANCRGEIFGSQRLDRILSQTANEGAVAVRAAIDNELHRFLEGVQPHDDLTLLVVSRNA